MATEPTMDLRALLARGFADTATAHQRKLGEPLRLDLADTALAVFDDDAQAKLVADMMERSKIRSMDFRRGVDMDIEAAEEICAAFVIVAAIEASTVHPSKWSKDAIDRERA